MPILRAGPFADETSSFLPYDSEIYRAPVNCATASSSSWPFRYMRRKQTVLGTDLELISPTLISVRDFGMNLSDFVFSSMQFAYQANTMFDMWLSYDVEVSNADPFGSICGVVIYQDGISIYDDIEENFEDGVNIVGNGILFTMSPTVKPSIVEVVVYADDLGNTGRIDYNVDLTGYEPA